MTNHTFLSGVQRPSRYLGREINAVIKDPRGVSLRVALLFPDLYEVAMSHLGLALLYGVLNAQPDIWAERAYAPAPDLERLLRSLGKPLASLESGTPLKEFDLLGVSLQYELGYTNFLNMLDLAGLPLLAADRTPIDPVVVGGGPACFNPEPVAPFFDALVLGDGEEVVLELAAVVRDWKARGRSRGELWQALAELSGVYVPALFEMEFDAGGRLREIMARGPHEQVHKRVLDDLNRIAISPRLLVPYCQIVHDRLNVEISRGCTRGCRYCQAGMIYRPVRERDPAAAVTWVEEALAATGFEEASLLTLSIGDYSALTPLLTALMDRLEGRRVALSLPSLRADTLTPEMTAQLSRVRRTGLTLAPEAGSERLRRVINKNLPEEAIIASAARAFEAGWQLLKLYFMLGLPTETAEDREAINTLAHNILRAAPKGSRPRLNLSLGSFIPKAHTPFQWERQEPLEEGRQRLHRVKDRLRQPSLSLKWNSAAQTWLEGIFSRGDRRLAPVLRRAHHLGCRLDAWSEELRLDLWQQAFREEGVDPDFYLRERQADEVLPWDHLQCGVSRDYLAQERSRAYQGLATPDCRSAGCQDCGVCDHKEIELRLTGGGGVPAGQPRTADTAPGERCWYRLTYAKLDEVRWLGHLEMVTAFYRALRRSGLPLAYSGGFHPLPRVSFHGALPLGVESLAEVLDLELTESLDTARVSASLNAVLPPGLKILQAAALERRKPPRPAAAHYRVESPDPLFDRDTAEKFLACTEFPITRRRPKEQRLVDLRRLIAELTVLNPSQVQVTMRLVEKDNVKVLDALAAIFGLSEDRSKDLRILKMKVI